MRKASYCYILTFTSDYGQIDEVRIQKDKGFAFVKYKAHDAAARAIVSMNGRYVGSKPVKCSWGKEGAGLPTTAFPTQGPGFAPPTPSMPAPQGYPYPYPSAYPYGMPQQGAKPQPQPPK